MRRMIAITAVVILLVFTVAVLAGTIGQRNRSHDPADEAAAGEQWEYLIVQGGTVNTSGSTSSSMRKDPNGAFNREYFPLESNMDKLGAKGWELVSVNGSPGDPIFHFKRKK